MDAVPVRDLRNHTSEVLRRVADGESLTLTVRGEAVAEMRPVDDRRPRFLTRRQVSALSQTDPGLRGELRELAGDTTDDLDRPG